MGNLLFSPTGRIGSDDFKKGAVILLALNVILWQAWLVSLSLGVLAFFLSLVLVYCWGCLFAKRLHGAGQSGWWYALIFIGFLVISYLIGNVIMIILSPELALEMKEFQENIDTQNPDIEYLTSFYKRLTKAMSLPFAISYFAVGALFSFGINALLKPETGGN